MAAIVQPAASSGGGGSVPDAFDVSGSVPTLAPGGTATICSTAAYGRKLRGFNVHGTTDGLAWVEIDGTEMPGMKARFTRVLMAYLVLPNPLALTGKGTTVTLRVSNEDGVTGAYEGVLLAE